MDGYIIARLLPGEAEEVFEKDAVRHVALLDDGNTFVAFDGEIPVEAGTIFENVSSGPSDRPQIRRTYIDNRTEYLGLYTAEESKSLANIEQLSLVGPDLVLVLSYSPLDGGIWTAASETILDKRATPVLV